MDFPRRSFLLTGLCGLALAGLTQCKKSGGGDANTIVVGEVAALSGGTATFGQSSHAGTQMAVDEINASGGLLGKKVTLITEDDQSKQGEAGTVAKKLISREKIVALLGEVASGRSLEMAPICQKEGVPMISPASTNPKVTEVGDHIFRVCFIDPFQGTVMAKFALARGWKKVAVMTDVKQDYSVGLSQYFKEYFTKNGGTIVGDQSYSSGDKDFKAQLTKLKEGAPDAILASGYYNETGLIAVQCRELGISAPLLGGDGWDSPSLVEVAGKAIEGSFFSNHFSAEDKAPIIQNFITKYKEKNDGKTPDAMAALGYDSMMILGAAIKKAGTTEGKALRDAIATTKDHAGITGVISLDEKRNANKPAVILTIKDGNFVYVETVAP
ncbi:amino acid/amide ABC transporter substrate-binding protein (HAAT family) [Roseimicrobium gellanilyticum]|uniref:Amino acid/amide ABC transporter substrate-binding protein (HAAT family) n=1 Tax=Roseimicrobium gellanilyticum TaxID=748857 RepID=A0A366HP17_9BACT|nr:ABC transporter substrate-binding protein [Roseimicrobium gellanilyticum]RBP44325.1 amino acid/amide ABC transporter substrate-binding protein (HAAT family) [Roseimicrobium gellanilyticum]